MNILVTGGAGYLGSVLVPLLLDDGHHVTVVDRLDYGGHGLLGCSDCDRFKFFCDDFDNSRKYAPKEEVDVVVHLAAVVGAPACDRISESETWRINCDGSSWLKQIDYPDAMFIFPMTNSGYGDYDGICTEDTPLNPHSSYAESKGAAEDDIVGDGGTSLRFATLFGPSPRMRTDLMVNDFVYRAVTDGVIPIFQGAFRRNFLHVEDAALAIIHAMGNEPGIYNVGNDALNMTKLELAQRIALDTGCAVVEINTHEDPDKRDYLVSSEKFYGTGFKPQYDLEEGVRQLQTVYALMDRKGPNRNA